MKKLILTIVIVSLLTLSMTACWGKFALTRKLYNWNNSLGNKWVSTIVMWVFYCVPVVAGLCAFIDVLILNTLEFWTGSNPLAMNEGEFETRLYAHEGVEYEITASKNRFDIVEVNNPENAVAFVFSTEENAWYLHQNGQVSKIIEEVNNETRYFDLSGNLLVAQYN